MMTVDLLITHASQLCTIPAASGGPQRGANLGELGLIQDGALAVHDGRIVAAGLTAELRAQFSAAREIDATGRAVIPGLVDPHTHVVWVGDRASEFEMRVAGKTYMDIMAAGGGIMSTVRATRAASLDELVAQTRPRLARMLAHGTTTAEAKTGYGLETAAEIKMLQAIHRLQAEQPVELVPTFLGAHAIPAEYRDRPEAYVDMLVGEMLPAFSPHSTPHSPLFCDVFCEDGAFTLEQTRRILTRARELGFGLKIHVDEFKPLGGSRLGVELGATSVDHFVTTPPDEVAAVAQSDVVAVSLPGTPFGLGHKDYSPARLLLEHGGVLALATDCNPGTCWCESMQFVIALACRYLRLTPAQALAAATINAAYAIGRAATVGSLEAGKQADIVILDVPDYRHLGYRFGTNLVYTVLKRGQVVVAKALREGSEPALGSLLEVSHEGA
jgi:imidazolonepropionase